MLRPSSIHPCAIVRPATPQSWATAHQLKLSNQVEWAKKAQNRALLTHRRNGYHAEPCYIILKCKHVCILKLFVIAFCYLPILFAFCLLPFAY